MTTHGNFCFIVSLLPPLPLRLLVGGFYSLSFLLYLCVTEIKTRITNKYTLVHSTTTRSGTLQCSQSKKLTIYFKVNTEQYSAHMRKRWNTSGEREKVSHSRKNNNHFVVCWRRLSIYYFSFFFLVAFRLTFTRIHRFLGRFNMFQYQKLVLRIFIMFTPRRCCIQKIVRRKKNTSFDRQIDSLKAKLHIFTT